MGLVIRCVSFGNCCDSYDEFCGDGDDGGGGGGGLGAGAIVRSNERERGEGEYIYIYICACMCALIMLAKKLRTKPKINYSQFRDPARFSCNKSRRPSPWIG